MLGSIGVLFLVPWRDTSRVRSGRFPPVYRVVFWFLIVAWLVLAYCGSNPPEGAYVTVARRCGVLFRALPDPVAGDRSSGDTLSDADQHCRHDSDTRTNPRHERDFLNSCR